MTLDHDNDMTWVANRHVYRQVDWEAGWQGDRQAGRETGRLMQASQPHCHVSITVIHHCDIINDLTARSFYLMSMSGEAKYPTQEVNV